MGEVYIGTKFNTIFSHSEIPTSSGINRLQDWGKIFSDLGMTPDGGEGNLSFRKEAGFIITATASHLGQLDPEDFVEVLDVDPEEKSIHVKGQKEPSSEAFMHHAIYEQRPEIGVIFHTHDLHILKKQQALDIPQTEEEQNYGTLELVEEVLKTSLTHNYFIIKNHGVVSLGASFEEAGEQVVNFHWKATS